METKRAALKALIEETAPGSDVNWETLSELLYTAEETGIMDTSIDKRDVETLLKLVELASIITDEELESVTM